MTLLIISILTGVLTAVVIRSTTRAGAVRAVRGRIHGHLLEFRLFFDEPVLIWRAWMALVSDNLRLFRLLLIPALILLLPTAWLFLQLDAFYGLRPLHLGEPAIVTVQLTRAIEPADRFALKGTAGVTVETPAVRVFQDNQVNWRIRASGVVDGSLTLSMNGRDLRKTLAAGGFPEFLSPRRSRSLRAFLLHPEEPRLPDLGIAWIAVDYPEAGSTWIIYFLAISTFAALASARWTGNQVNWRFR